MKILLPNKFFLELDRPGRYYYYRPGFLANIITVETARGLLEPARSFVLDAIEILEGKK